MVPNRNQRAPGFAPGEPEAPVAAPEAAPAPPAPGVKPEQAANEDAQGVPEAQDGHAVPGTEVDQPPEDEPQVDAVAAKAQKAAQYLELAQRTKADFENYRKRAAREAAAAQQRGVAKLARELLPAVDNLDRALAAVEGDAENGAATLVDGIRLVHAEVLAALARVGIERFSPEGERFDPQRHEAIAQQPVDGADPGTVVEVYQRGYVLGDFVIRPARVVVAA